MRLLSIDPGEVHCGLAYFEDDEADWHLVSSWEETPEECFETVCRFISEESLTHLIVEKFQLYPWKSEEQSFSQMKTVEVIGVLRFLHSEAAAEGFEVEWIEQGAVIKKPTASICRAKGIKSQPKSNQHMKDAQLHGWYYILRLEGEEVA